MRLSLFILMLSFINLCYSNEKDTLKYNFSNVLPSHTYTFDNSKGRPQYIIAETITPRDFEEALSAAGIVKESK